MSWLRHSPWHQSDLCYIIDVRSWITSLSQTSLREPYDPKVHFVLASAFCSLNYSVDAVVMVVVVVFYKERVFVFVHGQAFKYLTNISLFEATQLHIHLLWFLKRLLTRLPFCFPPHFYFQSPLKKLPCLKSWSPIQYIYSLNEKSKCNTMCIEKIYKKEK